MRKFSFIEIETVEFCEKIENQDVWDLSIENDPSYCIEDGIIVHNCLSSTQLGVHYPMASLLDEINTIREGYKESKKTKDKGKCKVIADGGMTGYSDIIKAIALGADYVMCGMLFSKAATGEEKIGDSIEYYGMSTKRAQQEMGKTVLKTSEGKFLKLTKEYTLSGWVDNFSSYLRSAMSYCNARTLEEFRDVTLLQVISNEMIRIINDK